ncbi:MAG: hypothetical protein KC484_11770 [Colwelliaceae bacterium]|jgi:hypothetical protein|nr:hypothetical protein [Colwelliaceae bacterium]
MKFITIILIGLGFLTGCASNNSLSYQERDVAYRKYIEDQKLLSQDRIQTFNFSGWRSLSNNYLFISTMPNKKYFIELSSFCSNLFHAQTIAINQGMSSSLVTRFDSISILDSPGNKCFIKSIYKVTKAQAKEISALSKIDKTVVQKL